MRMLISRYVVAFLKRTVGAVGAAILVVAMLASPAEADRPTVVSANQTFLDVNPCTGELHTVSITLTLFLHDHGDLIVERSEDTVTTTPTGYSGGGTATYVETEGLVVFRLTDVLTNEAGSRILARTVFVLDKATGTARVDREELTCVRP
ncbi:hypothetical protein ACIBL3_38735 [Kribbella sp. NPDC050124]|uniref:hypothetical protein n=1 Tax=Kribbella sp. NPDC050124 TaxID=3364114 RepID=UPI0037AC96A0